MKSYKKDEISITPNYFDTLQFQENTIFNIQKPSRRKKTLFQKIYMSVTSTLR